MTIYEAWEDPDDNSILLATSGEVATHREKNLLGPAAELLYRFEAATWEEANAIHALRMGWEPYRAMGPPAPCPRCGAAYYPEGSAQCWRCGASE
jgi:hypothetical protein